MKKEHISLELSQSLWRKVPKPIMARIGFKNLLQSWKKSLPRTREIEN